MSKHVLVIDDDEAIRKSFTLALEDTGYQVETAESGEKGIGKTQNTKYDLIFLDLKMPGLDGVATLREIRKRDKDVPVYIVTAFHNEFFQQLKSAVRDRIDFEILMKPIGGDRIRLITKGILEGPVIV
jgi:DNA-binding response OmpR family regulator